MPMLNKTLVASFPLRLELREREGEKTLRLETREKPKCVLCVTLKCEAVLRKSHCLYQSLKFVSSCK